ncbi:putative coenzyme Q-binding protein COQ10 B, mitochondrial-like [Trypanosoma rangeli]|uniref:Putative coenzyme Q-binding protein COQ10 B, mitochondrial-like n=1 Tax=Trypanosoma rangeli TaxID=5698 RepID=A0A3R7N6U8_TRYRA|nr:putative coenzyme Q-binding protein COQ10 B, mitochondrial-like [Trypanosoma rangeli]RNE97552.1 putative coenzyme Q-binding protein COQ10 B, mitochondrial-like [Trypanosoma rangeli]|eukprot:RNE97552.1 putative coenzyme Q-binding protein COQ10 B, mitochondrial-like [Trypanosoma rangeli]
MRAFVGCWGAMGGYILLSGRRSFFTPLRPPLPPELKPAPAASDAKPFFGGGVNKHAMPSLPSPKAGTPSRAPRPPSASSPPPHVSGAAVSFQTAAPLSDRGADASHAELQQHCSCPQHAHSGFLSPEAISKYVPTPARFAASLVVDALNLPPIHNNGGSVASPSGTLRQEYTEHCVLGWSPADLYHVVADVAQYSTFLPWCVDSTVHQVRRLDDVIKSELTADDCSNRVEDLAGSSTSGSSGRVFEMFATLTVGFSFFKEQYTSRVLLVPEKMVQAVLKEDEKKCRTPVLSDLNCVWEFSPVPGRNRQVEVRFLVSFAFKNPLHSKLIMSHVVTLMTRSFEKHCEKLYGPPSCQRERLFTQ